MSTNGEKIQAMVTVAAKKCEHMWQPCGPLIERHTIQDGTRYEVMAVCMKCARFVPGFIIEPLSKEEWFAYVKRGVVSK